MTLLRFTCRVVAALALLGALAACEPSNGAVDGEKPRIGYS